MGRRKKPEPDNKEQSAKFIEIGKKILADDAEKKFEEACSKIFRAKQKKP